MDENSDFSFEKEKQTSTGALGRNHNDPGVINGAPRYTRGVICPRVGTHPWGPGRERHKLIPREPDIIWPFLF